jgi:uncharacterized heparinase superfamily protein
LARLVRELSRQASRTFAPVGTIGEATALRQGILRLIPGDPAIADELYAVRYGKDRSDNFIKLTWLKHFAASGKTLHALYAMDVLKDWLQSQAYEVDGDRAANALLALAWDGALLARRSGGEAVVLQAINRLARTTLQFHPRSDQGRLLRGAALLSSVVVTVGLEPLRRIACDDMARAIDALILADGGHRSRRGDDLLRIVLMLLPLAAALREAHEMVPDALLHGLERMVPMLRLLTLDDGGLTSLHGEAPHREALASVFASDYTGGQALERGPHSGISRVGYGSSHLIADEWSMAFEFAAAGERLGVASIIARRAPLKVRSEMVRSREGAVLRFDESLSLRRSIFIAARGNDLRCEDFLAPDECVAIDVPKDVTIAAEASSGNFRLETPGRQLWSGIPRGAVTAIEGKRILLLPNSTTRDGRVNWALKRTSA